MIYGFGDDTAGTVAGEVAGITGRIIGLVSGNQGTMAKVAVPPPSSGGIFGLPKEIMYVGGGVLALGALAFAFTKFRGGHRALHGYRSRRKRVRR